MINYEEMRYRLDMLDTIRNDKLRFILPKVMKNNDCDFLIHVLSRGRTDMYELDFGCDEGYFICCYDENKIFKMHLFTDDFCKIPSAYLFESINRIDELGEFVNKINPKNIAVNTSDKFCACDGLSLNSYNKLLLELDECHRDKIISSEFILSNFTTNRVASEISMFSKILEFQTEIEEEAYRTIVPGKTRLRNISMYAGNRLLEMGIEPSSYLEIYDPVCLYSDADQREWYDPNHVIREGDLLKWDNGYKYVNFETDNKRTAYVLRKGEYKLPEIYQNVWDGILDIRDIIRKNVGCGDTAKNTLDKLSKILEEKGYIYTPYEDNENDYNIVQSLGNYPKLGFSVDMHCVGNTGFSENAVGPSIAPFRHDRKDMIVNDRNIFSFEFHVHYWNAKVGKRLSINSEENAIITSNGVEMIGEGIEEIILI